MSGGQSSGIREKGEKAHLPNRQHERNIHTIGTTYESHGVVSLQAASVALFAEAGALGLWEVDEEL